MCFRLKRRRLLNTSGTFYCTTDGATWTASTAMGTTAPSFAACAISPSGLIVAFFTPGQTFMTSPDGASWTPRLLPSWANGLTWVLLQHNGQYFLAISNGGVCATSADGINWISHNLPIVTANANNYPNSFMAWNGTIGLWLLINSGGTTYYTSPDGATWTPRTLPTGSWPYVASAGSTFFLQDSSTNNSIYSRNGITWTQATQRTPRHSPATMSMVTITARQAWRGLQARPQAARPTIMRLMSPATFGRVRLRCLLSSFGRRCVRAQTASTA